MTPLQVRMMLHFYTTPVPYAQENPPHANSQAVIDQRACLHHHGLIEAANNFDGSPGWRCTDRGKAYIEAVCAVQVPICKWVQPDDDYADRVEWKSRS